MGFARAARRSAHIEATLIERLSPITLARAGAAGEEAARRRAHRASAERARAARRARAVTQGRERRNHARLRSLPAPRSTRRSRPRARCRCRPISPASARRTRATTTDYQTLFARERRRRRRADGGAAFHAGASRRRGGRRRRAASRDAACRRRHVSAGEGGGHRRRTRCITNQATLSAETAAALNEARARGGRIVAVGTTALRMSGERGATSDGALEPLRARTNIFITPGYRFRAVDALLTNFHLPRSTLFMLVCAFCGLERMKAAYAHAIDSGYRFYSYGDACLLFRADMSDDARHSPARAVARRSDRGADDARSAHRRARRASSRHGTCSAPSISTARIAVPSCCGATARSTSARRRRTAWRTDLREIAILKSARSSPCIGTTPTAATIKS